MAAIRLARRTTRTSPMHLLRPFSTSPPALAEEAKSSTNPFAHLNSRANDTAPAHRKFMTSKPLNPHLTNTTSTIANTFPSVGADKPPADQLTSVDPNYTPKDSIPENTARMTGGTQGKGPKKGPNAELDVGEIDGGRFRVEPHRRTGEEMKTLKARLLYQSRKRGTLESDLLCSTFASKNLDTMTYAQLHSYDLFLDENDWDIYYWATQTPSQTSRETAEGAGPEWATPSAQGKEAIGPEAGKTAAEATGSARVMSTQEEREGQHQATKQKSGQVRAPGTGEWAQTVGTFKPAYRPVPARWKNSEILAMLRKHVIDSSAGGVHEDLEASIEGQASVENVKGTSGGGLGFMPELKPVS